jgi:large repetitive protein
LASSLNTFYFDGDADGYGDPSISIGTCTIPTTGYVIDNNDCNDSDFSINPGATEIVGDPIDQNCDGIIPYICSDGIDNDQDGLTDANDPDCISPTDNDEGAMDTDQDTIPDSIDNCPIVPNTDQLNTDGDSMGNICDVDDDNDGVLDQNDINITNPNICGDMDADGCDDCSQNPTSVNSPQPWPAYTPSTSNDGTDTDSDGICNIGDTDDDNDGVLDQNDCDPNDPNIGNPSTWYQDADGDTYGNYDVSTTACIQPQGYVANSTDCNDTNPDSWRVDSFWYDGDFDGFY